MSGTLKEKTWSYLLKRINDHQCVPVIGAGASSPPLPLGSTIAADWAREYDYPGDNPRNLIEVAQFLTVLHWVRWPQEEILKLLDGVAPPDFTAPDEPHGLLADLPLKIYLTTNYDDFMMRALKARNRSPHRERSRWNKRMLGQPSVFDNFDFYPSIAEPVVFHLHGHSTEESIVLTEDDYVNFLINVGRDPKILMPKPIEQTFANSARVFIGYRLADWNFRVLFQGILRETPPGSIVVLKPPGDDELARRQRWYLSKYYGDMNLEVYWGTAREFTAELRERWNTFSKT